MTGQLHRYGVGALAAASIVCFLFSIVFLGASSAWADFGINGALWPSAFAAMAVVGALIGWRRAGHPIAWTLTLTSLFMTLNGFAQHYATWTYDVPGATRPGGGFAAWLALWAWIPGSGLLTLTLLLFPTGRSIDRRWSWLTRMTVAATAATLPAAMLTWADRGPGMLAANGPDEVAGGAILNIIGNGVIAPLFLAGPIALVVRFRRARGDERQQLKWLVFAGGLIVAAMITMVIVSFVEQTDDPIEHPVAAIGFLISMTAVPVAAAIAILKYRLYDIDVVISKTVVFAGLAAFITAIYVSIVVGVGTLLGAGGEPNLALSIVATAVVAVAFQPVRERFTRLANRLVFGRRATPYEVLSRFSSHLGETVATEDTLAKMARLLADGTGAAHAQVSLLIGGQMVPAASVGQAVDASAEAHTVEVTHQGETLGALSVTKKRGETLTPADIKLVDDLAAQAGLLLRNVRLTEELKARIVDLRASRQRLVAAQDQERRRLERDLHDGAQQQIVAMKLKLGIARTLAQKEDAPKTVELVDQLMVETDEAVQTLRELAHGIYPPLLAAEGLEAAISTAARRASVPVTVHTDGIGRYDQDVEAAVYFCVLEAITNAAKYASPSRVVVRLQETDGHLTFTVSDDGTGFDPDTTTLGHGLTNMTDRLDALGGAISLGTRPGYGTSINGSVPVDTALEIGSSR